MEGLVLAIQADQSLTPVRNIGDESDFIEKKKMSTNFVVLNSSQCYFVESFEADTCRISPL